MTEIREVRLPAKLCQDVEQRFSSTFGSLEELLAFVLQELSDTKATQLDESERRMVEERLRELGYL